MIKSCYKCGSVVVSVGSPSHGGDVVVYVFDINQPSLPTPFYSVLVSMSVFMALSTVFHSRNSLNNSPFSDSVLPDLALPYWSFQQYIYTPFNCISFSKFYETFTIFLLCSSGLALPYWSFQQFIYIFIYLH